MKYLIPAFLLVSFLFIETGCKKIIDDVIDCAAESILLSIDAQIDTVNIKLVHFEFINDDTEGKFTLDKDINWNFGDGKTATSTNNKVDHTYSGTGDYDVVATYTLHRGSSECTGPKEKTVTIN
ncbi:MAG TPA: PKD domain-containing protein [Bacteroidetes bacterium]|nr:PKD domain-containing protein [Bacteroidota bacterium]